MAIESTRDAQSSESASWLAPVRMRVLLSLWTLCFAFTGGKAIAEVEDVIYFGGAAFTGAAADAGINLPITHEVIGEAGLAAVNSRLIEAFEASPPKHFDIEISDLARLDGTGSSTAMAVAIDRETITVEQVGGQHKLLFELAAQALFFDFRERIVRFAYPVTIQRIEVLDVPPDRAQIEALSLDMLMGRSPASLAPAVAAALENVKLPRAASRRLQVTSVSWDEKVAHGFPDITRYASVGMLGHEFSKILSAELELGLLPYQSGHAIGGAMAARFADGRVYNLVIPAPDYEIQLKLDDFRGKTIKETPAFRQDLLGAFFHVHVQEPLSGRTYIDQPLRYGAIKTIPSSQRGYDKESAYYEALLLGVVTFAKSITESGASQWAKEQPDPRALRASIQSLRELIEQCR